MAGLIRFKLQNCYTTFAFLIFSKMYEETICYLHWDLLRFLMVPVAKPASSKIAEFCQARRNSTVPNVPSGIDRCEGKALHCEHSKFLTYIAILSNECYYMPHLKLLFTYTKDILCAVFICCLQRVI